MIVLLYCFCFLYFLFLLYIFFWLVGFLFPSFASGKGGVLIWSFWRHKFVCVCVRKRENSVNVTVDFKRNTCVNIKFTCIPVIVELLRCTIFSATERKLQSTLDERSALAKPWTLIFFFSCYFYFSLPVFSLLCVCVCVCVLACTH